MICHSGGRSFQNLLGETRSPRSRGRRMRRQMRGENTASTPPLWLLKSRATKERQEPPSGGRDRKASGLVPASHRQPGGEADRTPPPPPAGSSSHGVKGRSDTVRRGRVLERFAKAKGEVSPGQRPGMDGPPGVREKAEDEGGRSQRGGREAAGSGAAEKRGPAAPRRLRDGCPGPEPRARGPGQDDSPSARGRLKRSCSLTMQRTSTFITVLVLLLGRCF